MSMLETIGTYMAVIGMFAIVAILPVLALDFVPGIYTGIAYYWFYWFIGGFVTAFSGLMVLFISMIAD